MEICKKCGADLDLIFKMVEEGHESDNWEIAWKIIKNCESCERAYKSNMEWLCENIP